MRASGERLALDLMWNLVQGRRQDGMTIFSALNDSISKLSYCYVKTHREYAKWHIPSFEQENHVLDLEFDFYLLDLLQSEMKKV